MGQHPPLEVVVWGSLACFTRPENKVERVSYPIMTPSAARGILEAILWKPQMEWRVREIHLLLPQGDIPARHGMNDEEWLHYCTEQPFRWQSILRNEINSRQGPDLKGHYLADEDRAQRHTLALRDVRYLICAEIIPRNGPLARLEDGKEEPNLPKHVEQFRRRVKSGACFSQPYLGCREFACGFCKHEKEEEHALPVSTDLGRMLFDLQFRHNDRGLGIGASPRFFEAKLERGVLRVPQGLYASLRQEAA